MFVPRASCRRRGMGGEGRVLGFVKFVDFVDFAEGWVVAWLLGWWGGR